MKTVNPKHKGHYKKACHELLEEIWGSHSQGRAQAYFWLSKEFKKTVHFSEINDEDELKEIFNRLWKYSFERAKLTDSF